ncbi:MAG: response regulator [Proteobacteria bacterium]|nr:response regulator [Pseudomonadota bacterium]
MMHAGSIGTGGVSTTPLSGSTRGVLSLARLVAATFFLLSLSLLCIAAAPEAGAPDVRSPAAKSGTEGKAVLILSGAQYGIPVPDALTQGIVAKLKDKGISVNDIYVENLDLLRHNDSRRRAALAILLQEKLATRNIGVVIAVNQTGLDFLAQEGHEVVPPDVPVIATIVDMSTIKWRGQVRPVQNIINRYDIAGTIDHGLALFPRTRRVVLVAGADKQQASFYKQAKEALAAKGLQVALEDTAGLTHQEMLQRIASLPQDALILFGIYQRDLSGRNFIAAEVGAEVAKRANVPVLALYEPHVRLGFTGGSVVVPMRVGQSAAELGFALLDGSGKFEAGDIDRKVPPQAVFDWLQVQRWGADPARLPENTLFLHRPRSIWVDYKGLVIAAFAVILVLSGLSLALMVQNGRRKRAELQLIDYQEQLEAKIEERTQALSESLAQQAFDRERLEYSLEATRDGLWDWSIRDDINYLNPAYSTMLGYAPGELGESLDDNWLALLHPEEKESVHAKAMELLHTDSSYEMEFRMRCKDGRYKWILSRGKVVARAPDGNPLRAVGTHIDLSTRKELELKMLKAQEAAEAANVAKSAFLANMSHEIRTPMNAITGLVHLLRKDSPTPQQAERLSKIEMSGKHLLSIINDILDLSKIEAGKLSLNLTDFALTQVLDHTASIIGESVRAKGLTLSMVTEHVPVWLCGDVLRIRQALLNFAGNAVKFTEQGSITLKADLLAKEADRLKVRFSVEDTGIGIAPDALGRLFHDFEQADNSATRKYEGTGLGLAISKRLAELMGGEAGCESTVGKGSVFWFSAWLQRGHGVMPLEETLTSSADSELRLRHEGARVLLAEDNLINVEVAQELLHAAHLWVDVAENGRVAVEKARTGSYELILMDMQMPEMDGLEATRAIRSLPQCADIPILAMTANAFDEDREACLAAGMNDFIAKPVEPAMMYATLLKWLPEHAASKQESVSTPPPAAQPATPESILTRLAETPGIDLARGLGMLRNRKDKYLELARLSCGSNAKHIASIKSALAAGDCSAAERAVHTL